VAFLTLPGAEALVARPGAAALVARPGAEARFTRPGAAALFTRPGVGAAFELRSLAPLCPRPWWDAGARPGAAGVAPAFFN
jgi:hypothetical protein